MNNIENLNFKVLNHSSIVINNNIYFDPYLLEGEVEKAKIIFLTHSHYDHLSLEDIKKIATRETIFVCTRDSLEILLDFGVKESQLELVEPNEQYFKDDIKISTFPSYNVEKGYHKKSSGWVGYLVEIDNIKYCICGDTDKTKELSEIKCDVLFIPIGGEFTMDLSDGIELVKEIKPKIAIPIHYGSIVGEKSLGEKFRQALIQENVDVEVDVFIK